MIVKLNVSLVDMCNRIRWMQEQFGGEWGQWYGVGWYVSYSAKTQCRYSIEFDNEADATAFLLRWA